MNRFSMVTASARKSRFYLWPTSKEWSDRMSGMSGNLFKAIFVSLLHTCSKFGHNNCETAFKQKVTSDQLIVRRVRTAVSWRLSVLHDVYWYLTIWDSSY